MNYNIFDRIAPAMPKPSKGTEFCKFLLSKASKDMREPLVPMALPALAAHFKRAYLHGDSVVTPSQVHEKVLHRHLFQSFTI